MLLPDLAAQDLMNLCSLLYFGKEESGIDFGIKQCHTHGSSLFWPLGSGSVLGLRIWILIYLIHEHGNVLKLTNKPGLLPFKKAFLLYLRKGLDSVGDVFAAA
jgi:hypothetical protein